MTKVRDIPISLFFVAGCELCEVSPIFYGIYQATNGDPCTTGCAYYNGGKCKAFQKLTTPAKPEAGQKPMETVRETAARLGLSISEVRRRRRQL